MERWSNGHALARPSSSVCGIEPKGKSIIQGTSNVKVKRAHMVSKGYLRAWADPRGRVEVIDLEHQRGFISSFENATVVSYAYEPLVLTHDLESEYAQIESRGIPAIAKLRSGHELSRFEKTSLVAFLDMHLDRGRYAGQADVATPAVMMMADGQMKDVDFNMADRMLISQSFPEVVRLTTRSLEDWPWQVVYGTDGSLLATGDGAVLLWQESEESGLSTVSFPLSPTQLLVIGRSLPETLPLNPLMAEKSQRWLIGQQGTFNMHRLPKLVQSPRL